MSLESLRPKIQWFLTPTARFFSKSLNIDDITPVFVIAPP